MNAWIAIALGGALGSVARHGVNRIVHSGWPVLRFPLATIVVNVVGCALIGVLAGLVMTGRLSMRPTWREFVFVGVLGGFTTYSTFGLDTMTLTRSGDYGPALMNVLMHIVFGIGAVYAGLIVVERFIGVKG